jgi:hypothetical protein
MNPDTSTDQLRQAMKVDLMRYGDGSGISPSRIIQDGRRRQRRTSRARRVAAGCTALAAVGGGAFALVSTPAAAASWSLAAPPDQVNQRLVDLVEDQLPDGVSVTDVELSAFTQPGPGEGSPEAGGVPLPRGRWSEADAWLAVLHTDSDATIRVFLAEDGADSEGDEQAFCEADVAAGYYDACEVTALSRNGQDVDATWREFSATRTNDGILHLSGVSLPPGSEEELDPVAVEVREFEANPGGDVVIDVYEATPEGSSQILDESAIADIVFDTSLLQTD